VTPVELRETEGAGAIMQPEQVSETLASDGMASGIEQETSGDQPIEQPFDPEKIDVITRSMTVDLLMSRIKSGAIDLAPDFQRRAGIWTDERQSRLIESLLLRIPLPTLYAAEDEVETWAIVDGIQRLTTIARFISPESIRENRLFLTGLEYLSAEFDGASFDKLPPRLQRRLRETELIVHVIRYGTPEEVKFNIFARINTGGLPLSSQELRHALVPGKARQVLKQLASTQEFLSATDGSIRDDRMADRELVLRYIAFRLSHYSKYASKDFDDFLRRAMREINSLSDSSLRGMRDEFLSALRAAHAIFERNAFRKIYSVAAGRLPINKAVFEAVAVGLGALSQSERDVLVQRKRQIVEQFMGLCREPRFDSAISQGTGDPNKVRVRFSAIERIFKAVLQ
jgi:hypothetical protein